MLKLAIGDEQNEIMEHVFENGKHRVRWDSPTVENMILDFFNKRNCQELNV
jgi:hypothetical protein